MQVIDLSKHIVEEISDADYQSPMLDLSPFPEDELFVSVISDKPKINVAEMVSDLLAA